MSASRRFASRSRKSSRRAFSIRHSCHGPAKNFGTSLPQLQHGVADGLQEPAVVGDQDDGGVHLGERSLEPFERGDVEVVGRLVEQEQVRLRGQRAGERGAGQLAAREGREVAVELVHAEAEAANRLARLVAPAVAAGGLEAGLRFGVGGERRLARVGRHPLLELGEATLDLEHPGEAADDVVAERQAEVARRALIVEHHAGALGERDAAGVGGGLAGEDAEERRLARAVAARERHAAAPLQPERDVLKKLALTDELGEAGGLDDGHVATS